MHIRVIRKVTPCWAWVAPLTWCCCCLQSHEILLNKGMKCWDSGLNGLGSRTFIITGYIASAVIVWRRWGKEMTGQTQFNTKFAAKLSFMPSWSLVYLFFFLPFFEISCPMWPNRGFQYHLCLTLWITFLINDFMQLFKKYEDQWTKIPA